MSNGNDAYVFRDSMSSIYYMTFLGNFLTGVFFLAEGVALLCKKRIPQWLTLCFTVLMMLIMCVTIVTRDFYIADGMIFLHFINPLFVLVFYVFFSNQNKVKPPFVFTALVMPFIYLIFAFIFGARTGNYIYYYPDYKNFGAVNTALFVAGIFFGLILISFGLYYLNRFVHKHILKDI